MRGFDADKKIRGRKRHIATDKLDPERMNRIIPVGTMGKGISLRVRSLGQNSRIVKQIETPRPPHSIMRRPSADREGKHVTHGAT